MTVTRINPALPVTTSSTLTSTTCTFQGSGYNWCRRYGNVVQFYIYVKTKQATTGWSTALAVLPSGYRPSAYTLLSFALGHQGSVVGTFLGHVSTGGEVVLGTNLSSGVTVQISGMFII